MFPAETAANSAKIEFCTKGTFLRQTSTVAYIAVDSFLPASGKAVAGFDEFTAALDHKGIPAVWLTSRSRLQFDEPRRRLGHAHPFIAEDGSGVYLPEGYFHLRPDSTDSRSGKNRTLRLGRFTCIPTAELLPAASDALEALSEETGVPIVTLRSLSMRELVQNTGLRAREAELAKQRDFDELFFFAGASQEQTERFLTEGRNRRMELRQRGVIWSAAIGASTKRCVAALTKLYDRVLRYHAHTVGIATADLGPGFFSSFDRNVLLKDGTQGSVTNGQADPSARKVELLSLGAWEEVLESVASKS